MSKFSATIDQLRQLCGTNVSVASTFDLLAGTAAQLPLPVDQRDLWFLLNLFGHWVPGIALLLHQSNQRNNAPEQPRDIDVGFQKLSAQEIDELRQVVQTLGAHGYLLLIDVLLTWLSRTLPTRRLKSGNRTDWTGEGLIMLVKDLDQTCLLPPALHIWAQLDMLRELYSFKAQIEAL